MRLGELIKWLEQQDGTLTVPHGFGLPNSYRGYYNDVAFEPANNVTFASMLANARAALEATFDGYKGGKYRMDNDSGCFIAEWGCLGEEIGPTILALWAVTAAAAD